LKKQRYRGSRGHDSQSISKNEKVEVIQKTTNNILHNRAEFETRYLMVPDDEALLVE
jgi:uncharacterized protein YgiM (DUF1202 family)